MSDKSAIEWTEATWNPLVGCDRVSPGCANCYAVRDAWRMAGNPNSKIAHVYQGLVERQRNGRLNWTGVVRPVFERLDRPFHWQKPRRVFVNSQSDLFHEDVDDDFIATVFAVMALTPRHTYQVLTKRAERMHEWMTSGDPPHLAALEAYEGSFLTGDIPWPLPNVHVGVSVEDQERAVERIPWLLQTPAAVRFLSVEPLLEAVDLTPWLILPRDPQSFEEARDHGVTVYDTPDIHWVIAGGESGPGARPMHPAWARSLRDQCQVAGVPFFFKQWGEWAPTGVSAPGLPSRYHQFPDGVWVERVGKKTAGRLLDGRTWDEMPEVPGALSLPG